MKHGPAVGPPPVSFGEPEPPYRQSFGLFMRTNAFALRESVRCFGLSDEDAITMAHTLSSKREGPFDGFEVWDHARFVWLPAAVTLAPSLRCASELSA